MLRTTPKSCGYKATYESQMANWDLRAQVLNRE